MTITRLLLAALIMSAIAGQGLIAQEAPKNQAPVQNEIAVIPVKHVVADEIQSSLLGLLGEHNITTITVDSRQNAVLLHGPSTEIAKIKDVITKLDVAVKTQAAERQVSVLALKALQADDSLAQALSIALGQNNFALDRNRNLLVIDGTQGVVDRARDLISKLEKEAAITQQREIELVAPDPNIQVRVIWLVMGGDPERFAAPPDDIKEVLPTLAKMGIDKPRMVGQAAVNTRPHKEFLIKGLPTWAGQTRFVAKGRYAGSASSDLDIRVTIHQEVEKKSEELCDIQTQITAPYGHFVILGMTPTEGSTSVLVVQVTKPEVAKAK